MSRKVTIQDIADALGVSRNTVSKAINNTEGLADSTREKILQKAVEMGYKQFSYVQSLYQAQAARPEAGGQPQGEIALLTPFYFSNSHFASTMLDRLQRELSQMGYRLNTHHIREEEIQERRLPFTFVPEEAKAVICIEMFDWEYSRMLCDLGLPILFVDGPVGANGRVLPADKLCMDNMSEISRLVNIMIGKGIRKIGFLGDYMHCEMDIVRDIFFARFHEGLDDRMTTGLYVQAQGIVHFRAAVLVGDRQVGETGEDVQPGQSLRVGLDLRDEPPDQRDEVGVYLGLEGVDTVLRAEDLLFVILEFLSYISFRIDKSLLAHPLRRDFVFICIPDFQEITEYIVVADLERRDSGPLALALLHLEQIVLSSAGYLPHVVQLGIDSGRNHIALSDSGGRIGAKRLTDSVQQLLTAVESLAESLQRSRPLAEVPDRSGLRQATPQLHHLSRQNLPGSSP